MTNMRIWSVSNIKKVHVFLVLIYLACLFFWWHFDHLWESLWIGLLFLIFVVIGLNIISLLICYILFDNRKSTGLLYIILLLLFPLSEYCTYYLAKNPLDSYYIQNLKTVANIELPSDIDIISKNGERPDLNGHYHYTFTAKFNSVKYLTFKESLLKLNIFNDTTELVLTNEQKKYWKINSNKLNKSLRILDSKGSLTVKLIDKEIKMVFLYNDI